MATHDPLPLVPLSPEQPDRQWERYDEPAFERHRRHLELVDDRDYETVDLGGGLIETHLAPPKAVWSAALPDQAGFYLIRPTGASRAFWKVIDVYRNERGHWLAEWTDVPARLVSELVDFEFVRIREPDA